MLLCVIDHLINLAVLSVDQTAFNPCKEDLFRTRRICLTVLFMITTQTSLGKDTFRGIRGLESMVEHRILHVFRSAQLF